MAMLRNTEYQLHCLYETVVVVNIVAMFPGKLKFDSIICSAIYSGKYGSCYQQMR
jgi:hypothetical protein